MTTRAELERIKWVRFVLKFSRIHHPPGPWHARGENPTVTIYNADGKGCMSMDTTGGGFEEIPEAERGAYIARIVEDLQAEMQARERIPRRK